MVHPKHGILLKRTSFLLMKRDNLKRAVGGFDVNDLARKHKLLDSEAR